GVVTAVASATTELSERRERAADRARFPPLEDSLASVEAQLHDERVFVVALLGAVLVGGTIGVALNRWRPGRSGPPTKRAVNSDNVDAQAGFRNMQGGT